MKNYKRKTVSLMLLLAAGIFIITGCADDNDNDNDVTNDLSPIDIVAPEDLTPDQADIWIGVMDIGEEFVPYRNGEFESFINIINPDLVTPDIAVTVNGEPVGLQGFHDTWYVEYDDYDFEQGEDYLFEVELDDEEYSISLKVPYPASETNFPETYDPSAPAEVTWSLAEDNQHQIAFAASHDLEQENEEEGDQYVREISASARQYEFPANAVTDFGEDTHYQLSIAQVNFNVEDKVIGVGTSMRMEHYNGYLTHAGIRKHRLFEKFIDILK